MQKDSPHMFSEVEQKVRRGGPNDAALAGHVGAIADELAEQDAFTLVNGIWVLSDLAWETWLMSGAEKKYRD